MFGSGVNHRVFGKGTWEHSSPKSLSVYVIQSSCEQQLVAATYSASMVDWATVRHGYPWVPTNQAHGRPRQVGRDYQKTHQPVSRPVQPDMWTWRREDSVACKLRKSRQIKAARISFPCCKWLEICFPVVIDPDSDPPTLFVIQYKRARASPGISAPVISTSSTFATIKSIQLRTGRRVLLYGGPNQYKIILFLVSRRDFCVLHWHKHRVLSSRFPHRTNKPPGLTPCGLLRSKPPTVGAPGRGDRDLFV
jgi:hypothetical protein